jgi:uncharacterized RDD family membrane protein YckC
MPIDHNPYVPPAEEPAPLPAAPEPRLPNIASQRDRVITYVVDQLVCEGITRGMTALGLGELPFFFFPILTRDSTVTTIVSLLWWTALSIAYFVLCEGLSQRTVGKLLVGTQVVDANGGVPTWGQIFTRSFARLVPFEAFSFLGTKAGWHDQWSRTRVVRLEAARR